MFEQPVLDLDRGDVLAAADDEVLPPALEVHVAVADHAEIAAAVPTVVVERLGRRLRVAPVAEEARRAANADLAHLTFGQHLVGLGVAHLQPHRGRRHADAVGVMQLGPRPQRGAEPGGLGAAVAERGTGPGGRDAFGQRPQQLRRHTAPRCRRCARSTS
jgi:hypothetical protein